MTRIEGRPTTERHAAIRIPHDPALHGVVRSFVTATCMAWGLDEEVSNDARVAVSEALAFSADGSVAIEVRPEGDGGLAVRCEGVTRPNPEAASMGAQLLTALASDLHWGEQHDLSFTIAAAR